MKLCFGWVALILPAALLAQPQIGGGQCASSTLTGSYSLTMNGRQMAQATGASGIVYSKILEGVGSVSFDGLSKVAFTLTNNTNSAAGASQSWTGTYTMQSNCLGTVSLTGSEIATFTLGVYNGGTSFFLEGYDGTYSLIGSGSTLPGTCSASLLNGSYSFNGNGFVLNSGTVGTANQVSGLLNFDGTSAVSANWYVSMTGGTVNTTATGSYTVTSNCTASATLTDGSGNKYSLEMVITAAKGTNFLIDGASSSLMFIGSGRTL